MHGEVATTVCSGNSVPRNRPRKSPAENVLTDRDYRAYLERLARYRKRFGVTVYAYCSGSKHKVNRAE